MDQAETDNGCLRVVPASHAARLDPPAPRSTTATTGSGNRIAEADVVARWGAAAIRSLPLPPGDVLLFYDLPLHSSHPHGPAAIAGR